MNQEQANFWYGTVYDAAEGPLKQLKQTEKLSRAQEAKARILLRRYLYDTLPARIMDADGLDYDDADEICREIYPTLMESVIAGIWSPTEEVELAMFLLKCEEEVDDEFTFSRLLGEILGREVSLKEAHDIMVKADEEIERISGMDEDEDLSQVFCKDMEFWAGKKAFYQGSDQDVMARIMDAAIQALRGLRALHENAKTHTDVRPYNMKLYRDGSLKMEGAGAFTSGGCTPAFAAPEQMSGKRGIAADPYLGIATDLYSWALSLLFLLLGERPWQYGPDVACRGNAGGDMLEALLEDSRVPVVVMLQGVLRDYLQEDPQKRPHMLRDERVLDLMLTKIYKGAIHREYVPKEALEEFLDGSGIEELLEM